MPGPRTRLDFDAIARAALDRAELLVGQWLPNGKRDGHEWKCGSLTGEAGESCSVNLNTGVWADFATDEKGGDLISLLAAVRGVGQGEAARELAQQLGLQVEPVAAPSKKQRSRPGSSEAPPSQAEHHGSTVADAAQPAARGTSSEKDTWRDAGAWPQGGPPAPAAHVVRGKPLASWTYRDAQGAVLGYVHRFLTSSGGKEIIPCVWSTHPAGGLAWKWRAFSDPRPLYGLQLLAARTDAPVLVVEGEKCADAAQGVLGEKVAVVTWPGGCKAVSKANWEALRGRRVVLWPDADAKTDKTGTLLPLSKQPGQAAMEQVGKRLLELGCDVRLVALPEPGKLPDGYDVADVIERAQQSNGVPADAVRACLAPDRLRQLQPLPVAAGGGKPPTRSGAPQGGRGDDDWTDRLLRDRNGLVKHPANVALIMRHDDRWRDVVAFDEFAQATVKRRFPPYAHGRTGEWEAEDDTRAAAWFAEHYQLMVSSGTVTESVEMVSREQRFHPVREHLRSLPWDRERRNEDWLHRYVGVADSPLARVAGVLFLRGMVRRVMEPGCKFDYCLVLEGAEGLKKSTLAALLGGAWGSDVPLDLSNNREAANAIHGKWVIEFSEMEGVTRAEAHLQKSFLSRQFDQYRPVWGKRNIKVPRQCVFIGTTNETEYIKEGQGARRFWPLLVTKPVDIEGLRAVLPQLLAEAVADYDAGERCYPSEEEQREIFTPEQRKRVQQEGLIDALHDWVLDPDSDERREREKAGGMFSLTDAAYRCLKISYAQLTRDLQTRVGKALTALECERVEKRNGQTRYWYKPPQKTARSSSQPAQHGKGAIADDDPLPF